MQSSQRPSLANLKEAVAIRERIESLDQRLSEILGGTTPSTPAVSAPTKRGRARGKMSPAARARIAAAMRARWARQRAGTSTAEKPKAAAAKAPKAGKRRRGNMTAEGRKKLSDAMKARWAARRKAS